MGQERSESRRCRNRHCRQQKQTASKGHCKLFSVCQKKLRSKNGMTLTEPNYEGVRIDFGDGWCLLRKSLHDPILPMNMASDEAGGCQAIEKVMKSFLNQYEKLGLEGVL